uniref:Uncharacterized protein n=1 Tax=Anopheles farauti TaxID=69004 RepID=A0A182QL87_9DIPT
MAKINNGAADNPSNHRQPSVGVTANASATSKQAPSAQKHCNKIAFRIHYLRLWHTSDGESDQSAQQQQPTEARCDGTEQSVQEQKHTAQCQSLKRKVELSIMPRKTTVVTSACWYRVMPQSQCSAGPSTLKMVISMESAIQHRPTHSDSLTWNQPKPSAFTACVTVYVSSGTTLTDASSNSGAAPANIVPLAAVGDAGFAVIPTVGSTPGAAAAVDPGGLVTNVKEKVNGTGRRSGDRNTSKTTPPSAQDQTHQTKLYTHTNAHDHCSLCRREPFA